MAYFRTSIDFEEAVFGCSASWNLRQRFGGEKMDFSRDIKSIILSSKITHPPTKIGKCLYRQVAEQLKRYNINPNGLVFLPSVDTKVDLFYGTDGLFFLPTLFPCVVTIDAFNLKSDKLFLLKSLWIDSFAGNFYSNADFQSDLFQYKSGFARWSKDNAKSIKETGNPLLKPADFRAYVSTVGRPENHFVMTPANVSTYKQRREFARLVSDYFLKVAGVLGIASHKKTASLSHNAP